MKHQQAIASVYRSYIREIRRLPHTYLRRVFRLKAEDGCRAALLTKCDERRTGKLKRVSKARLFSSTNSGNHQAFNRILDLAYGRVGRLRWELMEPLLSDPNAPLPPPIIPSKESSRPPVYSQELTALLTSGLSRRKRPLVPGDLSFPPILPERADPNSSDAQILGPFSKRREVNARWKYFGQEWKKVLPPLQISVLPSRKVGDQGSDLRTPIAVRKIGFDGTTVLEELVQLTKPKNTSGAFLQRRWLRRRYQELLGRLPILTFIPAQTKKPGGFSVSLASNALKARSQGRSLPCATDEDVAWNQKASGEHVRH
ncbi:uncharacterized protein HD556DRAFT_1259828 [Suillus plorans]|uniref:LYR motif-containing protein Cup1-like N-terminal domain-containing protein n=1 Tax=Suillus plorans TaxID=116603 RepID=A0A9P7E452_9AGAM|nr:uncharacterized protein HD556DRAFT_1259828 [Suillus plorans]KAG1810257.1 hypothetical protein HD556DRAFT_1259828 [Suillus plorans]